MAVIKYEPIEPPSQEVKLPSKGIPYKNDGKIEIRPITVQEEKILATGGEAVIDKILRKVIKSDINIEELTPGDESFILVWLRLNSYFDDYSVELLCPACKSEFKTIVKVSKFPVYQLKEGIEEPYELEVAGVKVGLRFLRRKDEKELEEIKKKLLKTKSDLSDLYLYRYAKAIHTIDGQEVKFSQAMSFLGSLTGKEMVKIRKALNDMKHGVEPVLEVKCKNCSAVSKFDIPLTAEFFLPSELPDDNGEDLLLDEEA